MAQKILLSGIKPTGTLHIGNYFGAIQQFVALQEKYDAYVFIANYHALTSVQSKEALTKDTLQIAAAYIACGLDPQKTTLYAQSDVPEVTELAWVLSTLTSMPTLMRAHAFKDAEAKNKDINVGTFSYPILMAADILITDAHVVPVGKDQVQHVEMAREMARKFNNTYGDTFVEPEGIVREEVETIPGTDGQKMSKSYNNVIPLFGTDEEWYKAVMGIVTDSKSPEESKDPERCNIFALHKLFSQKDLPELERRYREGGIGYKESKDILLENIKMTLSPMRERYTELMQDPAALLRILREGGERARARTTAKMATVRDVVGLTI